MDITNGERPYEWAYRQGDPTCCSGSVVPLAATGASIAHSQVKDGPGRLLSRGAA